MDEHREQGRQADPGSTAEKRLLKRKNPAAAIQQSEINKQQNQDSGVEDDPEGDVHGAVRADRDAARAGWKRDSRHRPRILLGKFGGFLATLELKVATSRLEIKQGKMESGPSCRFQKSI